MRRKTKIICTIGPSSEDSRTFEQLLKAGMNIARFNFSHGTHAVHEKRIETLRRASKSTGIPVALLLDTKGPQIRTGAMKDDAEVFLKSGNKIEVTTDPVEGTESLISVNYEHLHKDVCKGVHILIADGLIDLRVDKITGNVMQCSIVAGGSLRSHKNVNVPEVVVSLPVLTEQDIADLRFGARMDMDFIAASFVQTAEDIQIIQSALDGLSSSMKVIAKIETREALNNIHAISIQSTGIMVARGDLGVQLPVEDVPLSQKKIIQVCNRYQKAVITATQMLESMIQNLRPTRAEVTDVANAIFDGTDAVMLSGETAAGKYPVQTVETMHKIAVQVENSREYKELCKRYIDLHSEVNDIGSAVAKSAHLLANDLNVAAILAPSLRGNSPKMLSKFRPTPPIVVTTTDERIFRQLLLYWGVYPFLTHDTYNTFEELLEATIAVAKRHKLIKKFDSVVMTAGIPLKKPMMLNLTQIYFIGSIIQRGGQGYGKRVVGKVVVAWDVDDVQKAIEETPHAVLVCERLKEEYLPYVDSLTGLIVRDRMKHFDKTVYQYPHITIVADIHTSDDNLKSGQYVGISGKERIVFHASEKDLDTADDAR